MIGREKLVARNAMRREGSGPTPFGDSSSASKSPQRSVAEADDEIRVLRKDFLSEAIEFMCEFLSDVLVREQWAEGVETIGAGTAEVFEAITGWVLIEDVRWIYLMVLLPYLREMVWIACAVVEIDAIAIVGRECNHLRFVEQAK